MMPRARTLRIKFARGPNIPGMWENTLRVPAAWM